MVDFVYGFVQFSEAWLAWRSLMRDDCTLFPAQIPVNIYFWGML
jgi:hypothetical protein